MTKKLQNIKKYYILITYMSCGVIKTQEICMYKDTTYISVSALLLRNEPLLVKLSHFVEYFFFFTFKSQECTAMPKNVKKILHKINLIIKLKFI